MKELEPRIEANGIEYVLIGDFYFPCLALSEQKEARPIGLYGRLHRAYIEEHHPIRYQGYVLHERLWDYLADVDAQANARMDVIMGYILQKEGITEDLKAHDQMEWVRRMNSIRSIAEEIVLRELIYV